MFFMELRSAITRFLCQHVKKAQMEISNSYYRASRAYRVYCTRPEGAKHPRASTINTVRNIEAL